MSSRPGDWNCRSCQHLNFQRRDSCQRCGEPRSGGGGGDYGGSSSSATRSSNYNIFRSLSGPDVRPGDWYCHCGTHNFANRSTCFKCGMPKEDFSTAAATGGGGRFDADTSGGGRGFGLGFGASSRPGWRLGDWICTRLGCNEHNFAGRTECYRCNAPRDSP